MNTFLHAILFFCINTCFYLVNIQSLQPSASIDHSITILGFGFIYLLTILLVVSTFFKMI